MKVVVLIWLVWFFAFPVAAQSSCGAALPKAPSLLDLRLGMTVAEVQNVFGRDLRVKVKTRGNRSFFQNYIDHTAPGRLAGVRALYLRFDEGRLYQAEVFFEKNPDFKVLEDLTAAFAARNNFPAALWQIKYGRAEINCGSFSIHADLILNPHLELTDQTARARLEAAREKKSKPGKP